MSEVVDRFPKPAYARYDWQSWFDGKIHKCMRGVDFDSTPLRFARAAYKYGSDHGVSVRARVSGDNVWIQFMERDEKRAPGRPRGMRLLRSAS